MEELDLLDIYRQLHADNKSFTHETKNSKLKSRIDFFLVSRHTSYNVKRTEERSSIAPDHKAIFLGLGLQSGLKRAHGTWKFKNTLLEHQDYIELINFIYPRTLEKYKDVETKQLLWELIKMELRTQTIRYSRKKRAEVKKREIVIQHNLDKLDYKIRNDADLNPHILDQYEAEKNELNPLKVFFFHYILIQYRQDHDFKNVKTKLLVNTHLPLFPPLLLDRQDLNVWSGRQFC